MEILGNLKGNFLEEIFKVIRRKINYLEKINFSKFFGHVSKLFEEIRKRTLR